MKRVVIFGNSGSGKSTLARQFAETDNLPHLDLDTIAWQPGAPPQRKPITESGHEINAFLAANAGWVVEGCYADLLELVLPHASEIFFLNLPIADCIANARNRPWEPHKYASKEAQDANLEMLTDWIAQYDERDDTFSRAAHEALFRGFKGEKTLYTDNARSR